MPRPGYVIDSISFAREGRRLEGELKVSALPRLADAVFEPDGEVRFELGGEQRADGDPFLNLELGARLILQCQRCLEPMALTVSFRRRFLLVAPGQEWPEDEMLDDSFDALQAEQSMDLVDLVEQEILLALPIAPRHDACAGRGETHGTGMTGAFAVLANLKRRKQN